jgi:hypothetical protein
MSGGLLIKLYQKKSNVKTLCHLAMQIHMRFGQALALLSVAWNAVAVGPLGPPPSTSTVSHAIL